MKINTNFFAFFDKFKKKEDKKEFYLALVLKPNSIGAILFEQINDKLVILSSFEKQVEENTHDIVEDELIQASDEVVSVVEEKLPISSSVHKTIFALPLSFVEEGKIKKEHLLKFKKLCETLDLVPVGFIVTIEAVIASVQKKDGVPLIALFVELFKNSLILYMVRAGNIVEVKHAEHSKAFAKSVELLLKNVTSFEVLPQKMVLLDYEDISNIQQEFLSFPWTKDLPFLHLPQVINLEKGFENEAVINGVAQQMGFDIVADNVHEMKTGQSGTSEISSRRKPRDDSFEDRLDESEDISDNFGFVKEEDVGIKAEEEHVEEELEKGSGKISEHTAEADATVDTSPVDAQEYDRKHEEIEDSSRSSKNRESGPIFSGLFANTTFGSFYKNPRVIGFFALLFLILGLLIYAYYNFILQAEVILFLDKKEVTKSEAVFLNSKEETNPSKKIIKMEVITVEKEGSKTINTTGKKETGEKAKGEVTVYNKTEDKKTFDKGTIVIGPNKLEYELSDSITIASTSAFSTNFSNTKAKVVAVSFGSEYNVPSASNFTIKNISSSQVFAKNDQAFSGGSKKEIQIVSAEDLTDLENTLIEELKGKVDEDFAAKSESNDSVVIPSVLSTEFIKKSFSKKAGEEAKEVTLNSKIAFKSGAYASSDLQVFMEEVSRGEVPPEYVFVDKESKVRLKDIETEKDTVTAVLDMYAVYTPKIDEKKIVGDVSGKGRDEALSYLEKIPHIKDRSIRFKRLFPFMPIVVPFNESNIKIILQNNG